MERKQLFGVRRSHRGFNCIPEEIIAKILLYLSAQDLHTYKSVSKLWSSLISNPSFINSHLNLIRSRSPEQIIFTTVRKPTNLIKNYEYHHFTISNHDNTTKMTKLKLPYHKQNGTTRKALDLVASCDGLLLFQDRYDIKLIYIFNPVTNYFQPLPPPQFRCIRHWCLVRRIDHKLALFAVHDQFSIGVLAFDEKTISSTTWKCMSFGALNEPLHFRVLSQLFLFQEEIHWLTMDVDMNRKECYCIYSVNVNEHALVRTRIPLVLLRVKPTDKTTHSSVCKPLHLLSEVKGSLCLIFVYQNQLQVFVLENRDKCLWKKSHTIPFHSLIFGGPYSDQFCIVAVKGIDNSNLDHIKVLIRDGDELLLLNSKNQETKPIGRLGKDHKLCITSYLHSNSLVTLTVE